MSKKARIAAMTAGGVSSAGASSAGASVVSSAAGVGSADSSGVSAQAPRLATSRTEAPPEPELTAAQENALEAAQNYLEFGGFSRQGLIDQLSSEYGDGFKKKDATFAVDHLDVNWKKEAVETAESYLESGSFSLDGLIEQLESEYGDQFTHAQAVYGAKKAYNN